MFDYTNNVMFIIVLPVILKRYIFKKKYLQREYMFSCVKYVEQKQFYYVKYN